MAYKPAASPVVVSLKLLPSHPETHKRAVFAVALKNRPLATTDAPSSLIFLSAISAVVLILEAKAVSVPMYNSLPLVRTKSAVSEIENPE